MISTAHWQLWELVLTTPSGLPYTVRVRAASQDEAIAKVLRDRSETWSVACDEYGNALIRRVWQP